MYTREQAIVRRDRKVRGTMGGIAPMWLVNDEFRPAEESCLFDLVFQHSRYGWVRQRYKYDAFNDVLYHMGESRMRETETLPILETEPYLPGEVATAVPVNPQERESPPLPPPPTKG